MAAISVGSGNYIRPWRNARLRQFPVAVSQTILNGDPIVLSTTTDLGHRVAKAGTDPATDRGFVGFAAESITTTATHNAATDKLNVWVADENAEFLVHVADAQALDNDDVSVEYGIVADATNNIYRLDRTETTAKVFRVLEIPGFDSASMATRYGVHGDTNGAYVVQVISPERLYGQ